MTSARTPQKSPFTKYISPLIGLTLFVLALWFLKHQLRRYSFDDVITQLKLIPASRLVIALFFTALNHFALTMYDYLGIFYVGEKLPYRKVALASFISYAVSHNAGFSAISGAPYRLRIYGQNGIHPVKTAIIIGFCGLSFWLGFLAFGGSVIALEASFIADTLSFNVHIVRVAGLLCLVVVIGYMILSWRRVNSFKVFKWQVTLPNISIASAQLLSSIVDWWAVANALYFLFPTQMPIEYWQFMGAFVVAQVVKFTSQVPGGIGVFESILIGCLAPTIPAPTILGAIIAYRAIYFILPFVMSVAIVGLSEIYGHGRSGEKP